MRAELALALCLTAVAAACSGSSDEPPIDPTFDNVFANVLAPRCTFAACHAEPTRAAQLDLTKTAACRQLVNRASCLFPNRVRVVPGSPGDSFFVHKLTGEGLSEIPTSGCSGETNALMPYGGSEIPEREMQLVNDWIAAGAPCDPGPDPMMPGPSPIAMVEATSVAPIAGETIKVTITLMAAALPEGQTIRIVPMSALFMPTEVSVAGGEATVQFDAYAARPASLFKLRVETDLAMGMGLSFKELPLRISGLSVAEVLSDPIDADDNYQWVKLRNLTAVPIDLAGYRISAGQANYDFTSVQLTGTIQAGECLVVGGPSSSYTNGDAILGQVVDFSPDLPKTGPQARGYAVTDGGATPVDTMLVGTNNNAQLPGVDGDAPAPFCDVAVEGQSVKRTGPSSCAISEMRPNQCP